MIWIQSIWIFDVSVGITASRNEGPLLPNVINTFHTFSSNFLSNRHCNYLRTYIKPDLLDRQIDLFIVISVCAALAELHAVFYISCSFNKSNNGLRRTCQTERSGWELTGVYRMSFQSSKVYLKAPVWNHFCLRSTRASCLRLLVGTFQASIVTQMIHSCIWRSAQTRQLLTVLYKLCVIVSWT